jgi:hypothetical protein
VKDLLEMGFIKGALISQANRYRVVLYLAIANEREDRNLFSKPAFRLVIEQSMLREAYSSSI